MTIELVNIFIYILTIKFMSFLLTSFLRGEIGEGGPGRWRARG